MGSEELWIVRGDEVVEVLRGREGEVLDAVAGAYLAHREGKTSLPHSTFLRFPGDDLNRIIALPAYLGGERAVSGLKWIASYPGNVEAGIPRASAVLILNSSQTGRPEAILESSIISASRTAASAAVAARELVVGGAPAAVGMIGTGVINREIARYLRQVFPSLARLVLFDLRRDRAEAFGESVQQATGPIEIEVAGSLEEVLAGSSLVSFATTAVRPHVGSLAACPKGAVILHISLRDLLPEAILAADNVVDDLDHVCRAGTSIHLAAEQVGHRGFVRATLADILSGAEPARRDPEEVVVFSPFGLGILDLAVGRLVRDRAIETGLGQGIGSFFPQE